MSQDRLETILLAGLCLGLAVFLSWSSGLLEYLFGWG